MVNELFFLLSPRECFAVYRYIGQLPKKGPGRIDRRFMGRLGPSDARKRMRGELKCYAASTYITLLRYVPVIQLIFRDDARRCVTCR